MKENNRNERNDNLRNSDEERLRNNTANESIREASGDPDLNLNRLKDDEDEMGRATERGLGNAGSNTGVKRGTASGLGLKTGVTGSDFDGQDVTP